MNPEDIRNWVQARRRAEALEQQLEVDHPLPIDVVIRNALALTDFIVQLHGWPIEEDRLTRRENKIVAESWARLRRYYGKP